MFVNGKSENIKCDDLIVSGKSMGISTQKCKSIISEIETVADNMEKYFENVNIKEETCNAIMSICKENTIR